MAYKVKGDLSVARRIDGGILGTPAWAAARDYVVGDQVVQGGAVYSCNTAHTSATFATETANWSRLDEQPWEFSVNNINTVAGHRYIVDAGHTINLPATPANGDSVQFAAGVEWSVASVTFSAPGATTIGFGQTGMFAGYDVIEAVYDAGNDNWVIHVGGSGGSTIYTADGTLAANRTVTMAGNNLTFVGSAGGDTDFSDSGVNTARGWFPNFTILATHVTATSIEPHMDDGSAQKIIVNNTSTGNVDILPFNSVGPGWTVSLIIENNDVVARNVVFASTYRDITGAAVGTVSVAAGDERVFTFTNDSAGVSHLTGSLAAAGADTVQHVNASGAITAWGSVVVIGQTPPTADMTLTLPSAVGNIGKTIKFTREDTTNFVVTLVANGAETLVLANSGGELNFENGALEVEATTSSVVRQVGQVGAAATSPLTSAQSTYLTTSNTTNLAFTVTSGQFTQTQNNSLLQPATARISTAAMTNESNGVTVGTNNYTITQAGRYLIDVSLTFDQPGSGPKAFQIVRNGAQVLAASTAYNASAGNDTQAAAAVWNGMLAANDTIDIRVFTNSATSVSAIDFTASIVQLPSTEVVPAGTVPVTPLKRYYYQGVLDNYSPISGSWVVPISTAVTSTDFSLIEDDPDALRSGDALSLSGRWTITADVHHSATTLVGGSTQEAVGLWRVGYRLNGGTAVFLDIDDAAGQPDRGRFTRTFDFGSSTTFELMVGSATAAANEDITFFINAVEEPVSTVVDPGTVPVETLHRARLSTSAVTPFTAVVGTTIGNWTVSGPNDLGLTVDATAGTITATQDGTYRVHGSVVLRAPSSNSQVGVYVNGVLVVAGEPYNPITVGDASMATVVGHVVLNAGDVVTLRPVTVAGSTWAAGQFLVEQVPTRTVVAENVIPAYVVSSKAANYTTTAGDFGGYLRFTGGVPTFHAPLAADIGKQIVIRNATGAQITCVAGAGATISGSLVVANAENLAVVVTAAGNYDAVGGI